MNRIRQSFVKRSLSALLALTMVLGMGIINVFAAETGVENQNGAVTFAASSNKNVTQLNAPVEDGVYYANINLKNASNPTQCSMGNAALRGSTSYLSKQPNDTEYKQLIVVKDGKATALVEFMPMGYIGMYGMLAELEAVTPTQCTQFGVPDEDYTAYTSANILSYHKTQDGKVVYDSYNDPNSQYVFDGVGDDCKRPAGFGREEEYVNISNQPYAHLMSLDVTPIQIEGFGDTPTTASEFTVDNAAFVHVFVPVMFSISTSTGDQYARIEVDWNNLQKVSNPENNVQYQLYLATQVQKGNYTDASYNALQTAITSVKERLTNIWPSQTIEVSGSGIQAQPVLNMDEPDADEQAQLASQLATAMNNLEEKGDKTSLNSLITEAEQKVETDYTTASWATFQEKLTAAKEVQNNSDASTSEITAVVNDLQTAMDALVNRANTDNLSALIATAKAKQNDGYTTDSWNALQTAITEAEAVVANPDSSQSEIESKLNALQNALDALIVDSGNLDKNNLPDGTYSIYGEMIKMNRQEHSMSNDAINHYIKLTVENGQYYLTMDFKGLSYLNRFGYLAELSYYENGYTFGSYGSINGTRVLADVLTTQKNDDGSDVIDEFNQAGGSSEGLLYPDQVKLPLVADALADPDGYVPLHVFVPVMEDISEGTGDQDVLLKLDWSTLTATSEDDPNFNPDDNQEQSPAVDLVDTATGIKVHADAGTLPEGVKLVVEPITSGADYDKATVSLMDVGKKFKLYNIHLVDAQGNEVQPNGTVTVSYQIPEGYDANNLAVYRMNEDGSKTLIKGTVENGTYSVIQKSFSQYALVEKGSTITDAQNTANSPKTGDVTMIGVFSFIALASAGAIAVTLIARKRKAE